MGRVILKERQFSDTGISLGDFEVKDLETFDIQYTDSDMDDGGGGQGGQTPPSHVPDPVDDNRLKKKNQDQPQGGGGGNGGGGSGEQEPKPDDMPDPSQQDFDPSGGDPDQDDPDMPDPSNDEEGGGGGGSSDDSVPSPQRSPQNGPNGEQQDNQQDGQQGDQQGQQNQQNGQQDGQQGDQQNQQGQQGGQGDQQNQQDGQQGDQQSQQGQQDNQQGGQGGSGHVLTQQDLQKADDDFDPGSLGTLSELEDLLKNMDDAESSSRKRQRKHEEEENKKPQRTMQQDAAENSAAKDIVSKAMQDTQNDAADRQQIDQESLDGDSKPQDPSMSVNDLLGDMGAGALTTLYNPSTVHDWKSKLERVLDKAMGFDIITNPNLINKKIEDAPPGREDEVPEIKNVVVMLDMSGSMGSTQFKQVISHLETMMAARKLTKAWFHIVGWGDNDPRNLETMYTKVKGTQFQKTIMSGRYLRGIWSTYIIPAFCFVAQKVHRPDAVIILTDGQLSDSGWGSPNSSELNAAAKFVQKNKNKIIWALTKGNYSSSKKSITYVDPTAYAKGRVIEFKGGSR